MSQLGKPSALFWIVGVIALAWNGLGVGAYLQMVMMSAQDFSALPELQQKLMERQPVWHSAAFPLAVFSGFVGAIMLLLRKRIAVRLFLLSLVAVLVQFVGYFILDGYVEFISGQGWIMPIIIPILAVGFWFFTRNSEKAGILS